MRYQELFEPHIARARISGHQIYGRCPFHDDTKASFSANLESGLWSCHAGCGSGNAHQFAERLNLPPLDEDGPQKVIVAAYDYRNEDGDLLYQVIRYRPKDFRQRRPDGAGGWVWDLEGVRRVPYRLGEVVTAVKRGDPVFITEGEKDADRLAEAGLAATTNPGGAGKWRAEYGAYFRKARVVILPDNDPQGERHAQQVSSALLGVAGEVKILRLPGLPPKGDVSDWLDAGHTVDELLHLATSANVPQCHRDGDEFIFSWPAYGVGIGVTRLRETSTGVAAEITVEHSVEGTIHWGNIVLGSTSAREDLVRKLKRTSDLPPWDVLLERTCRTVVEEYRRGVPVRPLEPAAPRAVRDLVEKLLPLGETAVFHGDGGSGKSLLALTLALAVATETTLPGVRPLQRENVLFLDYESTEEEHQERLHALILGLGGLGVQYSGGIYYRPMVRPIADEAVLLRAEISRLQIGLVIVDSLAPACGVEPETADSVIRAMNALRSFGPASRMVTAHVSKAGADHPTAKTRPFGSVFVQNLARSVWEVRASEDEESGHLLPIGLYHRKANRGRRHPPFGLRFDFLGDAIFLRSHNLDESSDLLARTSLAHRIRQALAAGGEATVAELAEETAASTGAVRKTLQRLLHQGKVIRLGEVRGGRKATWGLPYNRSEDRL